MKTSGFLFAVPFDENEWDIIRTALGVYYNRLSTLPADREKAKRIRKIIEAHVPVLKVVPR